jgi:GAF domain-containing protein
VSDTPDLERLQAKVRRLHGLIETSAIITSTLDLDEVLRLVLEKAQSVANAEASAILLYNPETGKLEFEVALGEKGGLIHRRQDAPGGVGSGRCARPSSGQESGRHHRICDQERAVRTHDDPGSPDRRG